MLYWENILSMLNKLIKIIVSSKRKDDEMLHELNVSLHNSVLKNKGRLISHCRTLACKTFGNHVKVKRVLDHDGSVLIEGDKC